uniref:Signal transducer and activator of transcription A-like n=1 Tax=Drosophila rhopaloa TaxID=1041015 RepID=A0A6P4DUS1_DRORH
MEQETAAGPAKKSGTTLSVDRAAFLLLRVRKVFKKKRQQRKERQAQQNAAAAAAAGGGGVGGAGGGSGSQSRPGSRKLPPPLLRSRTLPAIIVPGLPVVSLHTDKQTFQLEERLLGSKSRSGSASGHRWSLLTRASNNSNCSSNNNPASSNNNNNSHLANNNNTLMVKSLNLPKDDSNLVYRRKSSGSTPHQHQNSHHHHQQQLHQQQQHQQHAHLQHLQNLGDASLFHVSDDFECHADGSLLLRIPAPHVVAARAYRLAARKRAAASSEASTPMSREHTLHEMPLAETASSGSGSASGSGSSTTFTRLAKLLHQSSALAGRSNLQPPPAGDNAVQSLGRGLGLGLGEEAPRRLSWESWKADLGRVSLGPPPNGRPYEVGQTDGWTDGRTDDLMTGQQLGLGWSAAFVFIRYGSRQANGDTCSRKINTPGASLPLSTVLA